MSTEFLSRHLFDNPQVRGTITGDYEVTDPNGVRWLVCGNGRGGWNGFTMPGSPMVDYRFVDQSDVNDLVVTILEGRR